MYLMHIQNRKISLNFQHGLIKPIEPFTFALWRDINYQRISLVFNARNYNIIYMKLLLFVRHKEFVGVCTWGVQSDQLISFTLLMAGYFHSHFFPILIEWRKIGCMCMYTNVKHVQHVWITRGVIHYGQYRENNIINTLQCCSFALWKLVEMQRQVVPSGPTSESSAQLSLYNLHRHKLVSVKQELPDCDTILMNPISRVHQQSDQKDKQMTLKRTVQPLSVLWTSSHRRQIESRVTMWADNHLECGLVVDC